MQKNWLDLIAMILVIVGALNWGLYAFGYNLVELIFGAISILETIVYALVGLAGIYMIYYTVKK
ncbi:MAG: DUF378 domain-containing protein [Nanoarchaeota archaeon]